MSALGRSLRDYLGSRRALGVKLVGAERRLTRFVEFMDRRGAVDITYPLALEWAMQPPAMRPTWALRFTDVRGFSRYLQARNPHTEMLPLRVLAFPSRAKPYIYTEAEIAKLLAASLALPPTAALRRSTYHALFGLLAVTGVRIGEALALKRPDVDLEQGLLTIRGTKFGKTRLVPLHSTTCQVLARYARRRDAQIAGWEASSSVCLASIQPSVAGDWSSRSLRTPRPPITRLSPSIRRSDTRQLVPRWRVR